jgi:hypothetical protein
LVSLVSIVRMLVRDYRYSVFFIGCRKFPAHHARHCLLPIVVASHEIFLLRAKRTWKLSFEYVDIRKAKNLSLEHLSCEKKSPFALTNDQGMLSVAAHAPVSDILFRTS